MDAQIAITVMSLQEAAVALAAVEKFRAEGTVHADKPAAGSPLADRIYAALCTTTFTKPSQVVTRVLLESPPSDQVPLSKLTDAFVAEGLAKDTDYAWHRLRAAFANISWLMSKHLPADDLVGLGSPVDVFAIRSLDQSGKRIYRLSDAGRAAAERFFKNKG